MQYSRLLFVTLFLGLLYAPAASAESGADILTSTQYRTPGSGATVWEASGMNPDTLHTRATFTKMVVDSLYSPEEIDHCYRDISSTKNPTFTLLYTDVRTTASYGKQLCIALRDGLARGYSDGSFRPDARISFADASKIISRAYVLAPYAETNTVGPWYGPYAVALSNRNAIPTSVTTFQHSMTASETNDILERLSFGITWKQSMSYEEIVRRSTPPPAPKKTTAHMSMQAPARTPIKPMYSSTSSMNMSSTMSGGQSSSREPWYKFY
jgi:hypothetical protein